MSLSVTDTSRDNVADMAVLRLLANPAQLQAKLDELEAASAEAKRLVALAGDAQEIPKLLADAETAELKAAERLSAADARAESIVAAASAKATEILNAAAEKARAVRVEAEGLLAQATAKMEAAKRDASALTDHLERENERLRDWAEALQAQADAMGKERTLVLEKADAVAAEKARLADVAGRLKAVAGEV